jgi:hypothetical protein
MDHRRRAKWETFLEEVGPGNFRGGEMLERIEAGDGLPDPGRE